MSASLSPLAPTSFPRLSPLAGVRLADHECAIRYKGRTDLLVVEMAPDTTVAGVFTKSLTCSAPVLWCKDAAAKGSARLLVVNSGNANAFTGKNGRTAAKFTADLAARATGCRPVKRTRGPG